MAGAGRRLGVGPPDRPPGWTGVGPRGTIGPEEVELARFEVGTPTDAEHSLYPLLIGFVNPRPIALVSTLSARGETNLAPFSFYNLVSSQPPVAMFAPATRPDGRPKDTLQNVRDTGEFVIATVSTAIASQAVKCAADLDPGESEFDFSALTPAPASHVKAPLVRESPVNIECTLREILTFGNGPGTGNAVFGDIRVLHVDDAILDERGRIDPHKLQTVGRLGGRWYCTVRDPYELRIPERDTRR